MPEFFGKRTAGAETNVAIGLARLGLKVGWASRVGADSMGRYLLRVMQYEGIDCSHVVADPSQRTGIQIKGRVDGGGDPPTEYHRKGSAASLFQPDQIDVPGCISARHLHATGVFSAVSDSCLATVQRSMSLMREAGRTVSFDTNLRPALWSSPERMREVINALAGQADWVLPGIEEGAILTGETHARRARCLLPRRRRPSWWSSSSAPKAPTSTATRAAAMCPVSRWPRWSTPSAPATVSRPA